MTSLEAHSLVVRSAVVDSLAAGPGNPPAVAAAVAQRSLLAEVAVALDGVGGDVVVAVAAR